MNILKVERTNFPLYETYFQGVIMQTNLQLNPSDGKNTRQCPNCGYPHASIKNITRRPLSFIGGSSGLTSGIMSGMTLGAEIGTFAGPVGTVVGAMLGGLGGTTAGLFFGHVSGHLIDKDVIGVYHCPKCGSDFLP